MEKLKYFVLGTITLSAPLYTHPNDGTPTLAGKEEYELHIETPMGPNGEAPEFLEPDSGDFYINDDSTRVMYDFVPTRAGTHYYFWLLVNPSSSYEKNFVVKGTRFAAYL